jgi:hypothetical protein
MESRTETCQCTCGVHQFGVRLERDEQVGLLTCSAGHHSLLLDSRDYWADILQEGRPKQIRCRCGGALFSVDLVYDFREDGDVRSVDVLLTCCECGRKQTGASFEIDYSPTAELISRPLDPIEQPWLKAKQCEITAYWQPGDAKRFASYLSELPGARIYRDSNGIEECGVDAVEFHPELRYDLYFTNMAEAPRRVRDPQKSAPLLRLTSPFHIACPSGIALLYYIEYAEEILRGAEVMRQPQPFLSFALQAREWLQQNYSSKRGRNTADRPAEYERIVSLLRRKQGDPPPVSQN